MAFYIPIVLLICLQVTGGLCQCPTNSLVPCDWQIAVIVLLSIVLFFIILAFILMISCKERIGCKQSQNQCSNDVYLQNIGCRQQQ